MKPLYFTLSIVLALFTFNFANAGEKSLWATMLTGGSGGFGVIYKVNPDGTNGSVAVIFEGLNGANPSGNMVEGPGGKLFGTTTAGGVHGYGVLFSYDPNSNAYLVLHNFDSVAGWSPRDLLLANDGLIYGTTQAGGLYTSATALQGSGVMYSYDPTSGVFTKLIDFNGTNGENPQGLMQANNNTLYGMARQGGANNAGVLYSYTIGGAFTKLLDFNTTGNGALPTNCKLIQANDNKLYGMTTWGGVNNMGTLFSYDISRPAYAKLFDFNGLTGSYPSSSLLQANNGVLYGVSLYGGTNDDGVIFKYNIVTTAYANLYDFNGTDGAVPFGSLIQGTDNLLYGMTTQGGSNGTGVIYDYDINTDNYSIVSNCDGSSAGGTPMSNLLELTGPTGIASVNRQQISLYPNPTTNQIVIQSGDFNPELVTIYDLNGQCINQAKFVNHVDVSSLSTGVYFVEIKKGSDILRAKLVKE